MKNACLIIFCLLLSSCYTSETSLEPSVEFTKIPMAEIGGTVRIESVEGIVKNSCSDCRIVIYTKSGEWYVQPFFDKPFTEIQPDGKWSNITHLGTEYAALLITPEFIPESKINELPEKSDSVIAAKIVNGTPMYWQTWWFRSLLVLLAVFLLVAFCAFDIKKWQTK